MARSRESLTVLLPPQRIYLTFRTLVGVGEMGMVMVAFTLSVELVGAKHQAFVGNMNQLLFAVGEIVVSGSDLGHLCLVAAPT